MHDRYVSSHQQLASISFHLPSTSARFSSSFIVFVASVTVLPFATSIVATSGSQHSVAAEVAYPWRRASVSFSDGAGGNVLPSSPSSVSPEKLSQELSAPSLCPRLCHCRPSTSATAVDHNHHSPSGLRASCGMNNMTSLADVVALVRPPLRHEHHHHPTSRDHYHNVTNALNSTSGSNVSTSTTVVYTDIVELDVSHNRISELPSAAFHAFPHLQLVDVSTNIIGHVDAEAFRAVHGTLRSLRMDANPLYELPHAVFWRLKQLTSLSLSRCLIGQLWPSLFRDTDQLTSLDVSSNRIGSLTEHTFSFELPHLVRLNLADNPLRFIHPSSFRNLPALVTLDLSHVSIAVFSANDILRHSPSLTAVDLSHNSLHSLRVQRKDADATGAADSRSSSSSSSSSLGGTTSLLLLTLYNTTIDCRSCVNVDALLYDETVSVEGNPTCSSPESVVGLPVTALLTSRSWTCSAMAFDTEFELTSPGSPLGAHVGDVEMISGSSSQVIGNSDEILIGESVDAKLAYEPKFEYSPMTGWYTAAFLGGMLIFTTVYLAIGNLRRHYRHKREAAERRVATAAANTTVTSASSSIRFPPDQQSAYLLDSAPPHPHPAANGGTEYELNIFTTTAEADVDADDEGGADNDVDDNYVELCQEAQAPNGGDRVLASSKCRSSGCNSSHTHHHHVASPHHHTLVSMNGGSSTPVDTNVDGCDLNATYECEYDNGASDDDDDITFPMIVGADGELYRIVEIHPECPLHALYLEQQSSSPSSSLSGDDDNDDDVITVQVHHHNKQHDSTAVTPVSVGNSVVVATALVEQHHNSVHRSTASVTPVTPVTFVPPVTPVTSVTSVTPLTISPNCHHTANANAANDDALNDVMYVDVDNSQ